VKETMSTCFGASRLATGLAVQFISDDSAQDLIEYALLTGIIGVAGVLVLSTLSTTMGPAYSGWNTAGQNAWQPCPPQPAACP
jgi:Flp pilus assembly pilin Flp